MSRPFSACAPSGADFVEGQVKTREGVEALERLRPLGPDLVAA